MQSQNRKFYLLVAAFLLCAVLTGVFSARSGKSSVEKWKDELRAKGEKFTLAELIPKRTGPVTNRTDELVRLGRSLSGASILTTSIEHFRHLGNGLAEAAWMGTNLNATHAIGPRTRGIPSATEPFEWDALATEMAAAEATLAEVHLLLRVPDHDLGWDYNPKTPSPRCFVEMRTIAQFLALANTHHLHAREPEQAFTNLAAIFQLAAWHDESFTVMSQMIRVALGGLALHSTWATLQAPGLTDAQLAALQTHLQNNSVLPGLARAFEFERAGIDEIFVSVRSGQETLSSAWGGSGGSGWSGAGEQAAALGWRAFLSDADELFYLRWMQEQTEALRKFNRLRNWSAVQPDLAAGRAELAVFETWRGRLLLISRMAIPNLSKAMQTAARHEARRELTLAAVALERFRRKHGRHPDGLDKLMPEFLAAVPTDWMDGKPLRYRLNADGTFTLWSVGEDFKDNGGDAADTSPASHQRDIWDGRDAVWPRLPKLP